MSVEQNITVVGAGIVGLWQALMLARAGYRVRLIDQHDDPLRCNASSYAGGMLAPDCEAESAPDIVRDLGRQGIALWRDVYSDVRTSGSLVVAGARDRSELGRFADVTERHTHLDAQQLAKLEPDLGERFSEGLFFSDEAHVATPDALRFLLKACEGSGVEVRFGTAWSEETSARDIVIDCRGFGARDVVCGLRGVRGERVILQTRDIHLARPVRLLHPRYPFYVVPWGGGLFMVGATVIESQDDGPITLRSGLELLGAAYALHPAFGEAQIVSWGAGLRPAFADNVPRVLVEHDRQVIRVNGAFRHGFLLAPVLAEAVCTLIRTGKSTHPLIVMDQASVPAFQT